MARITREQAAAFGIDLEPAPDRASSGASAHRRGKAFEDELDGGVHERYWLEERAHLYRLPVHTAPMPRPAAERAGYGFGVARILSRRQHCDFQGATCCEPYRPVVMEAKSCGKAMGRLPIVPDDAAGFGIKVAQLAALSRYADRSNAVAAIVWRNGDRVLVLGPRSVVRASREPRVSFKSIPADWFAPCAAGMDWLTTAMADWSPA